MDSSSVALLFSTAIQQAVELIDTLFVLQRRSASASNTQPDLSAPVKRTLALLFAIALVLGAFPALPELPGQLNPLIAHLIWIVALSAGTEGVNSILKYLTYAKENKKGSAADALQAAPPLAVDKVERGSTSMIRNFAFAAPAARSTEDRVVAVVERWIPGTVFDTRTNLETLWLSGPRGASLPFATAGLQLLCGDLANEFRGERDLGSLVPAKFKVNGGDIKTVDDLIEEVSRA